MPRLTSPLALAALALAAVVTTQPAEAAGRVTGTIKQKMVQANGTLIVLDEKKGTYLIPTKLYDRHARSVKKGAPITLVHDGQGAVPKVVKIERGKSGTKRKKLESSGTVRQKYDDATAMLVMDNGTFPVDFDTLRKSKKALQTLLTLRKGDKVIYWRIAGKIVDITRGAKGKEVDKAVQELIEWSKAGDKIKIRLRGAARLTPYHLRKRGRQLEVKPILDGKVQKATIGIDRWKIAELINPKAIERRDAAKRDGTDPKKPRTKDPTTSIRTGDMIAIGLSLSGQVTKTTDDEIVFRLWQDNAWGKEVIKKRTEVRKFFFEKLDNLHPPLPLHGGVGELEIKSTRQRKEGGNLKFSVELNHTGKTVILVNLKVTFRLSRQPCMNPKAQADHIVSRAISVPLFADQRHVIRAEMPDSEYLDGRASITIKPTRNIVQITDTDARQYLIVALRDAEGLGALEGVYQAAATNGDDGICRLLIGRYQNLEREKNAELRGKHRAVIKKALQAGKYTDLAPKLILQEIKENENSLRRYVIRDDALVPSRYRKRAREVKRDMVAMLAAVGGLRGDVATEVFDLSWRKKDSLQDAIDKAWMTQPDAAVAAILPVAIDQTDDPAGQSRTDNAKDALRRLGESVIPALLKHLREKGKHTNAKTLHQEWINGEKPSKIVSVAIEILAGLDVERRTEELQSKTNEAESLRTGEDKDLAKALKILREVLKADKEFRGARTILPDVLVDLGREEQSKNRGEAAKHFREALEHLKGGKRGKAATPLAKMMIEGAREDTESIVIRTHPDTASAKLATTSEGKKLDGKPAGLGWVQVETKKGSGFIRKVCVTSSEKGPSTSKWTVSVAETPYATIKEDLDNAKELAKSLEGEANQAYGELCAREGEARYESGDYPGALYFLEEAAKFAPSDPRLSLKWKCWVKANTAALAAVLAVILLALGIASMQAFSKPKKVKFAGEYRHYGADRSARERDLDIPE